MLPSCVPSRGLADFRGGCVLRLGQQPGSDKAVSSGEDTLGSPALQRSSSNAGRGKSRFTAVRMENNTINDNTRMNSVRVLTTVSLGLPALSTLSSSLIGLAVRLPYARQSLELGGQLRGERGHGDGSVFEEAGRGSAPRQ